MVKNLSHIQHFPKFIYLTGEIRMEIPKKSRAVSLIFKIIIIVSAVVGTILSYYAGLNSFMGGNNVFKYFTIQSNIAAALISLIGGVILIVKRKAGKAWYVIKFVGTVAITLTGVVFTFVLAPTLGEHAWVLHNILTHVVVPVVSIADFFVVGRYARLKKRYVFFVVIPPLLYAVYSGIGYIQGWEFAPGVNYPYFFLNWGSPAGAFGFTEGLPFMGSAWWIIAIFIFLIIIGLIYLLIVNALGKKIRKNR